MSYKFPFEKLEIWHLSILFSKEIYAITNKFPKEEIYGITSQLRKASNSIGANIAEGMSRSTNKEKARFLQISFSSLMEVLHFFHLSKSLDFITEVEYLALRENISELSNKINAFHKHLL